jgi:hypothetical protein
MDWLSRFVLWWALSITLGVPFWLEAIEQVLTWG